MGQVEGFPSAKRRIQAVTTRLEFFLKTRRPPKTSTASSWFTSEHVCLLVNVGDVYLNFVLNNKLPACAVCVCVCVLDHLQNQQNDFSIKSLSVSSEKLISRDTFVCPAPYQLAHCLIPRLNLLLTRGLHFPLPPLVRTTIRHRVSHCALMSVSHPA